MKLLRTQKGMSPLTGLLVIIVLGFLATVVFKLVPHYLDNNALNKVIVSVAGDSAASRVSTPAEFYAHISRGMQVNGINDIDMREAIKITQQEGEFIVDIDYEKSEQIISNISLVIKFNEQIRVRPR